MSVEILAEVSRRYGGDTNYVLAGGGNTSYKDETTLFIKASGFALATIEPDGFVRMDRQKLAAIWEAEYPDDSAQRESRALEDLMNARFPGEEAKRPSVETLVHESLEEAYVVHTHPALVNGLTCSIGGEKRMKELFGDDALWVPVVDPGYILARTVRRMRSAYIAAHGKTPTAIFLQNHGVFISADTVEGIDERYAKVFSVLREATTTQPDFTAVEPADGRKAAVEEAIRKAFPGEVSISFEANRELITGLETPERFEPFSSAYTPDHIVYAGHKPLYIGPDRASDPASAVADAIESYHTDEGRDPKLVAVSGLGIFGVGDSEKAADRAVTLFLDAVKIAVFARSHGGHSFLPDAMIRFIMNWEVESYRSKVGK